MKKSLILSSIALVAFACAASAQTLPSTPAAQLPAAPKVEVPAVPAVELPAAPKVEVPAVPAVQTPAAPALPDASGALGSLSKLADPKEVPKQATDYSSKITNGLNLKGSLKQKVIELCLGRFKGISSIVSQGLVGGALTSALSKNTADFEGKMAGVLGGDTFSKFKGLKL